VREYPGNYSAFLEARQREEKEAAAAPTPTAARAPKREQAADAPRRRKLTFKERQELGELEARIAESERRQAEIEAELTANASDAYLVHRLYEERETLAARLARDLDRWAELAELA
jgi:ATP-binding cassette subfamily F protein uup